MEQQQNQRPAPAGRPRLTREQWLARRRRKRLRLLRNWVLFLSACGMAVGLMTGLILWLLPRAGALLGGSQQFEAPSYDLSGYVCDPSAPYLVLVHNNLPRAAGPAPGRTACAAGCHKFADRGYHPYLHHQKLPAQDGAGVRRCRHPAAQ